MSYTLGQLPSSRSTLAEKADFMEYQCFISDENRYSAISGETAMGISYDEQDINSDDNYGFEDALSEIEDRWIYSGEKYPFETLTDSLKIRDDINSNILDIYKFLLLATRENMRNGRIADGIDGTALFEKLCAIVLKNYFGGNCVSFVFGTGQDNDVSFRIKAQDFFDKLNEGKLEFRVPDGDNNQQKDGKLDIVVFIPFADDKKGQFIAFGQCKTGTTWRSAISQLNPEVFCKTYCSPTPGFTPICVFMVAESFTENWELYQRSSNGILFDRSRIMNYLPDQIDAELLSNIKQWNMSVIERIAN